MRFVRILHLTTEFPPVTYGGLGTACRRSCRCGYRLDVRITLKSGRRADIGPCLKSANSGREQPQQGSPLFRQCLSLNFPGPYKVRACPAFRL